MSIQAVTDESGLEALSAPERETRLQLAAAYRLMAHFGITDLTHNHLTARVPDEPDCFLIKPGDFLFDEVTASSLEKYDFDGNPRQHGAPKLRGGGLIIHAGLFAVRKDVNVIFHTHTPSIIGVATQKQGLLPLSQHGARFHGKIAYHDFGGYEFEMEMRAPLIKSLGDKNVALLRNHGSLVCGASVGDTFVAHHNLEMACQNQLAAMSGGGELVMIAPEVLEHIAEQDRANDGRRRNGGKDWTSLMRMVERVAPDYRH
ncbi:MAG: class II aldolase/adducin family protein [Alphaproteobacteria bacterium]|nr:class II aldolase/adducin family protein [Alphaproteobacteria bacterium]